MRGFGGGGCDDDDDDERWRERMDSLYNEHSSFCEIVCRDVIG